MPQRIQLAEAATICEADASMATAGRLKVALITPGWGSSGYYSAQVLEAAATAKIFPAGLHMYLDHEGEQESYDRARVGRSVRDLAAVLTSDATWDGSALVAEAQMFAPYSDVLAEMKDAIGVSIRGDAAMEAGEAEGRQGVIITELVKGTSADFVTHAGRGGAILQVLESARTSIEESFSPAASLIRLAEARNVGQWFESRMHLSFTQNADDMFGDGRLSREERIAMSSAVGDALAAFTTNLQASAPQLYLRDLWEDPQVIASAIEAAAAIADGVKCGNCKHLASAHKDIAAGDNMGACTMANCDCKAMVAPAAESAAPPKNVPVIPAGLPTATTDSLEDHMAQIQVDEAEYGRLTADAGRVQTLESERDAAIAERDTARTERAQSVARDTARPIATTLVGESTSLPPMVASRVIEAAVAGVTIGADGAFNEAAFRTLVEAARTAAETEVASIAEALGVGKVTNFGPGGTPTAGITEAEYFAALGITKIGA